MNKKDKHDLKTDVVFRKKLLKEGWHYVGGSGSGSELHNKHPLKIKKNEYVIVSVFRKTGESTS